MLQSGMRDAGVDVQVAHAAERFFSTAGTTRERGPGGDLGDDEAQERMIETERGLCSGASQWVYVSAF
jgi:hypothetical protein